MPSSGPAAPERRRERPPRRRAARLGFSSLLGLRGGGRSSGCGRLLFGALRAASSAARASSSALRRGFGLELGGDLRVVFRAQVDLFRSGAVLFDVGLEALLALEGLDLLDGHFQLVRDPRVGATLSHPPADLVKLRTQGPAAHRRAGD